MKEMFKTIKEEKNKAGSILKLIKYPERSTVTRTTLLVIISMCIISAAIFLVDTSVLEIYNLLF